MVCKTLLYNSLYSIPMVDLHSLMGVALISVSQLDTRSVFVPLHSNCSCAFASANTIGRYGVQSVLHCLQASELMLPH